MARHDAGLENVNLLDLRPVRTAPWGEADGRAWVERPLPPVRGLRGLVLRLSFLTGAKRLRLDDLGSAVWSRLDGEATVGEVCEAVREEFGERCEPAEERLRTFLGILRREHLVGYPGWDDERIDHARRRAAAAEAAPVAETAQ
jgi:hypothetical protein